MTADSTVTTATAPGAEYADTASAAYRSILQIIESVEPRIAAATRKELADQRDSLKLIASENYASPAALLTMGTWLSDKYAEGTIGHRFYAGCQNVDTVETVAAEHARELFGSPYAYVQPHSGIVGAGLCTQERDSFAERPTATTKKWMSGGRTGY